MDDFKRDPVSSKVSQRQLAQRKDALNTKLAQLLQKQRSASAHGAATRFKRKCGTSSRIIANDIESNPTVLLGRKVHRFFPGFGGIFGVVRRYHARREVYEIELTDGSTEHLPYDDILLLLQKSKRRRQAEANYSSVAAHLLKAMFEAHAANGIFRIHRTYRHL